jgi:ABC-type spermidine/putrescine transport system permease subunit I
MKDRNIQKKVEIFFNTYVIMLQVIIPEYFFTLIRTYSLCLVLKNNKSMHVCNQVGNQGNKNN